MQLARTSIIAFLIGCCYLLPSLAQAQAVISADAGANLETLQIRLQEAEASSDYDEITQSALVDLYRKSISLVEQRRSYETATAEFIQARESAPKKSAALRKSLEKLESRAPQKLPDSLSRKALPVLEQQLLSEKADQAGLTTGLAELEARLETQLQRAQQARDRLTGVKKRQPEIVDELQLPVADDQPQRLTEAQRWALELEARALAGEIEMLEQELLSQPMRVELLGVRRDKATLELNRQQQYVELLETLVVARRLSEAESVREEAEETERMAFGKHELVQDLAQQNTLLGEELNTLAAELERVTREENAAAAQAKRVSDNFRLARQKLEIAGLSEALGQVLLEQRRGLPDSGDFKVAEDSRRQLVIESSLRQIRNQQERARMRDINVYVDDLMMPLSDTWRRLLRLEFLQLAELRRDLLDKAIAAEDTYLQALGELDFAQRQLS